MHVFRVRSPSFSENQFQEISKDKEVLACYYNRSSGNRLLNFVPNDPFIKANSPISSWGQWFLIHDSIPSFDIRVRGAWERDVTGAGVVIGFLDQGVEANHPDLAENIAADLDFDFLQQDNVPEPVFNNEAHGMAVAGLAAARGGNGIGISGVAPLAQIASMRLGFTPPDNESTDADFVDATKFHSFGNDVSIKVKNHSYGEVLCFVDEVAEADALKDSASAGTIHCMAGGNFRMFQGEDSNKKDITNGPEVITVGAMGIEGIVAVYSCFGANVFVVAPSAGGFDNSFGLLTTDRVGALGFVNGDYLDEFSGTSGSSPIVAGVMALGTQVKTNLNVRWAKHVLARTARLVDPQDTTIESDGGWKINQAGFAFNQNYGFGLVDADRFTAYLTNTFGVTPLQIETNEPAFNPLPIPDNQVTGVTVAMEILSTNPLEEVEVALDILHDRRGDLEGTLTSPQGTTARIFRATLPEFIFGSEDNGTNIHWSFTCNTFWGENPKGVWKLTIKDLRANISGVLQACQLRTRSGQLLGDLSSQNLVGDWNVDGRAELLLKQKSKSLKNGLFFADTNSGEVTAFAIAPDKKKILKKNGKMIGTHFFNEDQMTDLLFQKGRKLEAILFFQTVPFDRKLILKLESSRWKAKATGDIDQDGKGDIVFTKGSEVWVCLSRTESFKFSFPRQRKTKVQGVITLSNQQTAILLQQNRQLMAMALNTSGDFLSQIELQILPTEMKVVADFESQIVIQNQKKEVFIASLTEMGKQLLIQSSTPFQIIGPR
ncbi:MAG: S8 family serine peptidase [Verrucomicrobiia bacterium]